MKKYNLRYLLIPCIILTFSSFNGKNESEKKSNILYAPWRSKHLKKNTPKKQTHTCVFCQAATTKNDAEQAVLLRSKHGMIRMNRYPYNPGHLLVVPYEHKENLSDFSKKVRSELMELTNIAVNVLKQTMKPNSFNVGINLGSGSGASIPMHLHIHVIPRWNSDTGFMEVIAETNVLSEDLSRLYKQLKQAFDNTTIN